MSGWYGLVAPAKTPKSIVERVHAEMVKALKNEQVLARLIARWNKVLTAAGVQPTN